MCLKEAVHMPGPGVRAGIEVLRAGESCVQRNTVPMWKPRASLAICWLRKSSVMATRWTAILEGQCVKC